MKAFQISKIHDVIRDDAEMTMSLVVGKLSWVVALKGAI